MVSTHGPSTRVTDDIVIVTHFHLACVCSRSPVAPQSPAAEGNFARVAQFFAVPGLLSVCSMADEPRRSNHLSKWNADMDLRPRASASSRSDTSQGVPIRASLLSLWNCRRRQEGMSPG